MSKELIETACSMDKRPNTKWNADGNSVKDADGWVVCDFETPPTVEEAIVIAEAHNLLSALADLAESEGKRADEAERERDRLAADRLKWMRTAGDRSRETETAEEWRDAALSELARLKGQQP